MYSRVQFAALELMCRERAALAKKEMEYALFEYWLAEAEEWKEFKELSDPFIERIANRSSDLARPCYQMSSSMLWRIDNNALANDEVRCLPEPNHFEFERVISGQGLAGLRRQQLGPSLNI